MRAGCWLVSILFLVCGCSVPRTFTPDTDNTGFDNQSGMELQAGDRIEVYLFDGVPFSGKFAALEGDIMLVDVSKTSMAGNSARLAIPLVDVERVVCDKTSGKEFIVSTLFLVPTTLMILILVTWRSPGLG